MPEIRVSVNLDRLTIGDFLNINNGKVMSAIGKAVEVQGYQNTRDVPFAYFADIAEALKEKLNSIDIKNAVSPIALDKISVVDIDKLTLGDMEDIECGSISVIARFVQVDGYADVKDVPYKALSVIAEKLSSAINEAANPKG